MPQRYQSRPSFCTALKWTGKNLTEMKVFCPDIIEPSYGHNALILKTPRGDRTVLLNMYILKHESTGHFSTCEAGGFELIYEPVN